MDSLSQIVLGAAVGEAVLGKKIGNRAMLWGAVAGTIPDLDVLANPFLEKVEALAFHRGISHSLFFAFVFSFLIAYLVHRLYDSGLYKSQSYRKIAAWVATGGIGAVGLLAGYVFYQADVAILGIGLALAFTALAIGVYRRLKRYYFTDPPIDIEVSYLHWYVFFFLSIFTHPILDCFTVYGTQLWAPFSDQRVAWGNISVADPLWTFPFALCLLILAFYNRNSTRRRSLLYIGWTLSSLYMLFTMYNQRVMCQVLKDTIAQEGIEAQRYMVSPTILNNILWSGTVETDDAYYQGMYSRFDEDKKFKLHKIPKNLDLVKDSGNDPVLETLKWFSNGYYAFIVRNDGRIQMNDLRYGSFNDKGKNTERDYIFRFVLEEGQDGNYQLADADGGPPRGDEKGVFRELFKRIAGSRN